MQPAAHGRGAQERARIRRRSCTAGNELRSVDRGRYGRAPEDDHHTAIRARYGLAADYASTYDGSEALPEARRTAYLDEISAARSRASLSDFVDHIDYIARRIGWQHVGIGTDFDHGAGVTGFDSAAEAPNVTRELLRRGYSEEQIAAIWGGNFLRVLRAAEAGRKR